MDSQEYVRLLVDEAGLSAERADRQARFREEVMAENEVQNLTRLITPSDFYESHFLDSLHLTKSGWLSGLSMDLGSGVGVPGIPSALLLENPWILAESEGRKADFLKRVVGDLGLNQVIVHSGRAENFLKERAVDAIVARAVGPVSRILAWIGQCSTWNKLILLKSKGWEEEWESHESKSARKQLELAEKYEYEVGPEKKYRVIVRLERK